MNEEQFKRVKFLLAKNLVSELNDAETEELNVWRKASAANENLYQRLSDKDYLLSRYRDFRTIKEMSYRTSSDKHGFISRPYVRWSLGIAAAMLLFFTGYSIYRVNKEKQIIQSLTAEKISSVSLSIDNNSVIDLSHYNSGDKVKNTDAVKDGNRLVYGSEETNSKKISMHTLSVPAKQIFSVVLPDGSKVWLASKSTITYPSAFSDKSRNVVLSGEGYFEIAKNPDRPFTVTAGDSKIKVTGTRFNLKAYKGDKKIEAALIDGKISFSYKDKGGVEKELLMHRGELSVLDVNSRAVETSKVNASLYNSWIDGVYFFDTQSLEEIMNDMGRYYSLDVVFLNGSMKNKVLSGRLHIEDNAETMLESFKKILPGHIKLEKKTIIIF
jgi:transmembrane sensor